jgi:L-threonylcarbamoyladenylate synthase
VIAEAVAALRAGQIVVFPTETVYGLGALALDRDAVKRVFEVKGRPATHPLIVHVLGEDEAKGYAAEWPTLASELAHAFWPGPLTLVVKKAAFVPSEVTGGTDAVALRVPSHPVARALLAALGAHDAIVAPSANRYQSLSPTRAEHVIASLGHAPGAKDLFIIDAGPCPSGIESTVIDVREKEPRVLRPGALSIPALRAVAPSLQYARIEADEGASRASPGQDKRHYAPRTPLVLAADRAAALERAHGLTERGERVSVILFGDSLRHDERDPGAPIHVLPPNPEAAGAALYALLYELDRQKYACILVEPPPSAPGWEAIADRIARAATIASPNTLCV